MPRPYFHKLILPSIIRYKRLRIPDSFMKKFGNEFTGHVRFVVPGGQISRIGLSRADEKFWFHDGWQHFVDRYSIRVGYFLIFRYEGNGIFNIHIFNLSSSEISYHANTLGGKKFLIFEELEDDDSAEHMSSSTLMMNKSYNPPPLQNLFSGSKLNNCVNWVGAESMHLPRGAHASQVMDQSAQNASGRFVATENKNLEDDYKFSSPDAETPKPKKRGRKPHKVDPNEQKLASKPEDESDMRLRFYESASARKRTVTAEERERAMNAAKIFEPENPYCRVVLRPSYLYKGCIMYLPSSFAEKYLNGVSGFIKLQLSDGKQWPVRCLYRGSRAKFSQGWYEFTLENNLGEGDVCVFELLKSRDYVLGVTVFRVLEDATLSNGR